ncbi:MAG: SoxR reducing system RseC family protein [Prevotella sp.]|nr:SoxR reducing system RseC family protein [Prevotella sp.]
MRNKIKHFGIVDEVEGERIKVRITQSSACSSCKVAGHCNASESKEKLVDVYGSSGLSVSKGDSVVVVAAEGSGLIAVVLTSVVPLLILVAVLVICILITGDEAFSALASLCALIPYYLVIYLFRNRIRQRLSFSIEEASEAEKEVGDDPLAQVIIN